MSKFEVIGNDDTDILNEIMIEAYKRLANSPFVSELGVQQTTPRSLVEQSLCGDASHLAVKIAHEQKIFAAREIHHNHAVALFTPPDTRSQETDTIMCLTWGQFSDSATVSDRIESMGLNPDYPGYVGARAGAIALLGGEKEQYDEYYGSSGVVGIQTAYAVFGESIRPHWITSAVDEVSVGNNPIGEISQEKYHRVKQEEAIRPFRNLGLLDLKVVH